MPSQPDRGTRVGHVADDPPAMNPPAMSDGELVAAVLAGSRELFSQLAMRYQGPLLRVAASRLGRAEWAEEAVQETFLCALKFLPSYDSRFSFRTWLWTIMLNQCHRHYQRRQRQISTVSWPTSDGEAALAGDEPPPSAAAMAREQTAVLERQLKRLPEAQADALRLRFFGGLKFHEIADAMGCSLSAAKNRVRGGLQSMSREMIEQASREGPATPPRPAGVPPRIHTSPPDSGSEERSCLE